jgi:hypothetical protein
VEELVRAPRLKDGKIKNMSSSTQPWRKRQEIPDPQVREAADQFESARQLLQAQAPGSGLLYPLMNSAAIAIELYLKCLSAEKVYTPARGDWSIVSARPEYGHVLTTLLDKVESNLRDELDRAFQSSPRALGAISFRDALVQCEGAFQTSRYPFEASSDLSNYPLEILMGCSHFLQQFVAKLPTKEMIQQ